MSRISLAGPAALVLILGLSVAGCSGSVDRASGTGGGVAVSSETATGSLGVPGAVIGGGIGVVTIAPAPAALAPPAPGPEQPLLGPWTLARSGDRGCSIDLGSRNAAGDLPARTRGCATVDLARIALWAPTPDGLVLYDFERRPAATLRQSGPFLFEGALADGRPVTLWR
jgi:hypothetical protein